MLRSALIAVFATALGTILASGSANATITVLGFMEYFIIDSNCIPPECISTLDPSNPEVLVDVTAGPGLPNVDVTDNVNVSLTIDNSSDSNVFEALRIVLEFSMTFTNPLDVFGSYRYNDGLVAFNSCSYPPRGPEFGPAGCSFIDSDDADYVVGPDTDMALDFFGTINAQAGTIPEPSSVGMLASALLVFGWLHRKQTMPTRSTSSG
jgi:hypothetical protein